MLKRFTQGAIRVVADALGATSEAQLQANVDRRMREYVDVDRPSSWKEEFRTTQTGGKITYLGRLEDQ